MNLHHAGRMSQISRHLAPLPEGPRGTRCPRGSREALLAVKPEQHFWVTDSVLSSNTLGEILHVTSTRCQHFLSLRSRGPWDGA